MSRLNLVPAGALLLACLSAGGALYLQHGMRQSEDARLALARLQNSFSQVQALPWQVMNPGYGTPEQIRRWLARDEQRTLAQLARLRKTAPTAGLDRAPAALRQNFQALGLIMGLGVQNGWGDVVHTNLTSQAESRSVAAANRAFAEADAAYAARARLASRMADAGAVGTIFALFAAFAVYYRRSHRVRRKVEQALAGLSRAQDERARLLARTVEVAEHERIRIASDLHDGPIQHLTALALTLDLLANRLARGALETVPALLAEVRDALSREMGSLRSLMVELRPPVLAERGLEAALADAAYSVFADSPVDFDVRCDVDHTNLAPELETAVYRVVREALVNAQKHSGATRVDVQVAIDGDNILRVRVVDDGRGFDPLAAADLSLVTGHGFGLMGIRERVEGLGGSVQIESSPGSGATIAATLPVKTAGGKRGERALVAA